jgi:Ras-related protein Rab-1A
MIGNTVGKSSLLLRFADDDFNEHYLVTIGVDFRFKSMNIKNKIVKMQIWDVAGQSKYRKINNAYYKSIKKYI